VGASGSVSELWEEKWTFLSRSDVSWVLAGSVGYDWEDIVGGEKKE
jgi:hypothetical protein